MNTMKKLFALLLALALVLSLAVPAMAANDEHSNHTITINETQVGREYWAYQIFAGDVLATDPDNNPATPSVDILTNVTWGSGVDYSKTVSWNGTEMNLLQALQSAEVNPETYGIYAGILDAGQVNDKEEVVTEADVAAAIADALGANNTAANGLIFAEIVSNYLSGTYKTSQPHYETVGDTQTLASYKINPLTDGYYMVMDKTENLPNTEVRSLYMLQLVENTDVTPKTSSVDVDKVIVDGNNTVTYNDYNVGDTVSFAIGGTLPDRLAVYDSFYYEFTDTMSGGLTLKPETITLSIYNNGNSTVINDKKENDEDQDYLYDVDIVEKYENPEDSAEVTSTVIRVIIPDLTVIANNSNITLESTSQIVVNYDAVLNENAVIGGTGNNNKVSLTFSNDPHGDGKGTTTEKEVKVYTFELDVTKVNNANAALPGAKFVLYRDNNGTHEHVMVDANGVVTGWTADEPDALKAAIEAEQDAAQKAELQAKLDSMTLVSGSDGKFVIKGLDMGNYRLQEIEAPEGFELIKTPFRFQIIAGYDNASKALNSLSLIPRGETAVPGDIENGTVSMTVINNPGSTLPETGGIGTTLFYLIGGALAVGAIVLLITKKRMSR